MKLHVEEDAEEQESTLEQEEEHVGDQDEKCPEDEAEKFDDKRVDEPTPAHQVRHWKYKMLLIRVGRF